jgi:uncharacterized paraquat-inducible protein A
VESQRRQKKLKQVNLNKRLYNLVSTYDDRELDVFLRGIAVNMCNLRSSRQRTDSVTFDSSVADTQIVASSLSQDVSNSSSFAPQYSTTTASANNRKRKGTHSQQNLTNKRSKVQ